MSTCCFLNSSQSRKASYSFTVLPTLHTELDLRVVHLNRVLPALVSRPSSSCLAVQGHERAFIKFSLH